MEEAEEAQKKKKELCVVLSVCCFVPRSPGVALLVFLTSCSDLAFTFLDLFE